MRTALLKARWLHGWLLTIVAGSVVTAMEAADTDAAAKIPFHAQGEKAGEPTQNSIILLTRLTAVEKGEIERDVPGLDGRARFELAETPDFKSPRMTPWGEATKDNDHIVKQAVTGLEPGRDYWYRVHITDASGEGKRVGPTRSFKTAPLANQRRNVRFAVITGQGYATRDNDRGHVAYHGIDKLGIDFIALTGDTVYYDGPAGGIPKGPLAVGSQDITGSWPRSAEIVERDDRRRSQALAAQTLARHVCAADPARVLREVRRLLADGRPRLPQRRLVGALRARPVRFSPAKSGSRTDVPHGSLGHGSANLALGRAAISRQAEQPATLWGREQFDWLVKSLAESDAVFKVIVSSSPVVGSARGGGYKTPPGSRTDNHGYPPFLEERKAFFDRVRESGVKDVYLVCGDRHAKYHTRGRQSRIHEFCCGSLSVKHGARGNYWPDQDVSGLVDVLHDLDLERTGGFLCVDVDVADETRRPTIAFTFHDPDGNKLDGWLFSNKIKVRERQLK